MLVLHLLSAVLPVQVRIKRLSVASSKFRWISKGCDIEVPLGPNLLEFLSESHCCPDYESLVVTCNMLYLLSNCSWIQYLKYGVLEEASECAFVWADDPWVLQTIEQRLNGKLCAFLWRNLKDLLELMCSCWALMKTVDRLTGNSFMVIIHVM